MRKLGIASLLVILALLIAVPNAFGEKDRPSLRPPKKDQKKENKEADQTSLEERVFQNIPDGFPLEMQWPFYSKKLGKAIDVWYVPRKEYFINADTIANIDACYFVQTDKNMLCMLSDDGALTWAVGLSFRVTHCPRVTAFAVYLTHLSKIVCLDRRNGQINWTKDFDYAFCTPPYATPTTLYIGTFNKLVVAIDRLNGRVLWTFALRGDVVAPPIDPFSPKAADYVLVPCIDNNLYAINTTGGELWKFKTHGRLMATPATDVVDDEPYIYFGSQDTNLYCVNAISSQKVWIFRSGSPITETPTIVGDHVYFRNEDGDFYCLDKRTGKQLWKKSGIRKVAGASTGSDVYFISGKNTLHAINPANGNERWSYEMKNFVKFVPNNADGNVIGLTKSGLLLVFRQGVER